MNDQTPPAAPSPATPSLPNAPTPIPTGVATTKQNTEPFGSRGLPFAQAPGGALQIALTPAQLAAITTALASVIPSGPAGGDLGGTYPNPTVLALSFHIVNANVDAAAAIDGTKINPDFGAQQIITTADIVTGENGLNGGQLTIFGLTSGQATIAVAATAGSPSALLLPTADGSNHFVLQTDGSGVTSWVNGANIPALNASNITSGTVPDSALSANVPLLNAANTFINNMVLGVVGSIRTLKFLDSDGNVYGQQNPDRGLMLAQSNVEFYSTPNSFAGFLAMLRTTTANEISIFANLLATIYGNIHLAHVIGDAVGAPPTIAPGTGAGTTPTVSIAGHDMAGVITVLTGTLPAGTNAVIVTVTLGAGYGTAQYPVLTPANAVTAALSGTSMVFASGGTTTWIITGGTVALAAATTYKWNYSLGGY